MEFTNNTKLTHIDIGDTDIDAINVDSCEALVGVYVDNTAITGIDLKHCALLEVLSIRGCDNLHRKSIHLSGDHRKVRMNK